MLNLMPVVFYGLIDFATKRGGQKITSLTPSEIIELMLQPIPISKTSH